MYSCGALAVVYDQLQQNIQRNFFGMSIWEKVCEVHTPAGQDECEAVVSLLEDEAKRMRKRGSGQRLYPVALYAGLPASNQLQALETTPRGYRKVLIPLFLFPGGDPSGPTK